MSYYSQLTFDLQDVIVDPEKIKEVEKYFANNKNLSITENNGVSGFWQVSLPINDVNVLLDIGLEDYYAKFYNEQYFENRLSECIISGIVSLYFTGEDGSSWGYAITNNKVKELHPMFLTDEEFNLVCQSHKKVAKASIV